MISASLEYLQTRLDAFLTRTFKPSEGGMVVLSNICGLNGEAAAETNNKIVMQLIRIEKDTLPYSRQSGFDSSERRVVVNSPVYLNLSLLIAANFAPKHYPQALRYLSAVVGYFQGNSFFDQHNAPDMPSRIEKLCLDIENVGPHDLSSIWSMIGAKYLPSVIYKVRTAVLGGNHVTGQTTGIECVPDPSFAYLGDH